MYENFNAPSTESLDSIFNRLQKIVSQLAILGENISQEDLNMMFLRSFPIEWNTHVVVRRNKPDLETMSFDDLYNNFKIIEQEVKRTITSSSSLVSQNMAFLLTPGSTNEVDTVTIQVSTISTPVSTVSAHDNAVNLSDATVYAFLANQPNGSQLVHEDLKQIHEDDLEKIDLKWQLALLSMRARRPRNQDNSRKTVIVEDTSSKAMVAIDRADWVFDSDEDESEEMILNSKNDQHKPEQVNQPRKMVQKPVLQTVEKRTGQRKVRPVWNNAMKVNHQIFSNSRRNSAPTAVLTNSEIVPISTAMQSSSRAATPLSTAMPINAAAPKPIVNVAKTRQNAFQKTHSLSRRPFHQQTTLKNRFLVNTAKVKSVNTVNTTKGKSMTSAVGKQRTNAVKSSACWV
nr:hypothetical protein [Tanacetum cinerariifolium]